MPNQLHTVDATADLVLRVPRGSSGDVESGARRVLERVERVERVESVRLTGVTPTLNDLQVDVTARLALALDRADAATVEDALGAPYGVARVVAVETDGPPRPAGDR